MARRSQDFQTIRSEGGLLPADLLRRILDPREKMPGTTPEEYGLPHGERINETITQSWNRLRRHWAEFSAAARKLPSGEAATGLTNDRWSIPLLRELGFGILPTSVGPEIGGRTYAINRFFGPVAIHLVGCGLSLDRRTAGARGAASANPHGLVQDFLNRAEGYLWGIVSNGLQFRILRDNQALSRQSYLEFDLEAMFSGEIFPDFVLLWLVAHATRFTVRDGGHAESCWLEEWTKLAEEQGARALESLKGGVEKALEVLGQGFVGHPRNAPLREGLRSGAVSLTDLHSQLLRVVYRFIFLFVAEDRTLEGIPLIHPRDESDRGRQGRERYAAHYSTGRLRDLASRIRGSRHGDLWHQFNLLVGALSGKERFAAAREHLSLPSLGSFLWSPDSTGELNAPGLAGKHGAELSNADLLEAIRHLAFTRQGRILRPVDYRNLGSEELGGVYESLLALTPQISGDGSRFTFAELAGNERKTSGSYYTPDSLVQCLLDSAVDPVVEEAIKDKSGFDAEKALLSLKVCDPAVGSGHFLVGAAHRMARHLARIRAIVHGESEPSPPVYQSALRDVIGHCLYGVDVSPMAAELCKVSLWLDALEPGKPLSFLDHHIRVGNSLLGATPDLVVKGIPDDTFKPIEGDDRKACGELRKRNKNERKGLGPLFAKHEEEIQAKLATAAAALEELPDNRPEDVRQKESKFGEYERTEGYAHKKLLADAWCSAFVIRKHLREPNHASGITQSHLNDLANDRSLPPEIRSEVERLSAQYRFFHWHLAFPEVFAKGGFDCVLGNPPWERVNIESRQFFASVRPDIVEAPTAKRRKLLAELKAMEPELFEQFAVAQRYVTSEIAFYQNSGLYQHLNQARLNTYILFAEIAARICSPAGRVGIVVPSGIATDETSKKFFGFLVKNARIESLFDFENRQGIFPEVHRSYKFCLLTFRGESTRLPGQYAFFLQNLEDLHKTGKIYTLTPEELNLLSPISGLCPTFRSDEDRALVSKIYRSTVSLILQQERAIDWFSSDFFIMLRSDDSSHLYQSVEDLGISSSMPLSSPRITVRGVDYLPVWESKLIHQFDHRFATFSKSSLEDRRKGNALELTDTEKDNAWFAIPRHWVPAGYVDDTLRTRNWERGWLLGYRDITNATNERTAIASLLPEGGAAQPLNLFLPESATHACFWLTAMNSFVLDYIARQRIGGVHLNITACRQLPIVGPRTVSGSWECFVRHRVLELVFSSLALESFASDCNYNGPPFHWDEKRRFLLRCELDAAFFHLYLGSKDEWQKEPEALTRAFPSPRHAVDYIMETFPIVKRKDEAAYGTYRTKDTILELYDTLTESIRTGRPYQTRLDPPPGPLADEKGNFLPLPEWKPGQPRPANWPSHIHAPKGVVDDE